MKTNKKIRKNNSLKNPLLDPLTKPSLLKQMREYLKRHAYSYPSPNQEDYALAQVASDRDKKITTRHGEYKLAKEMVRSLYKINNPKHVVIVKKSPRLTDAGIALVMHSCYHFAYFLDELDPKLMMLNNDPHEDTYQLYTYHDYMIIHEINRIEPSFNTRNKNDVLDKIATLSERDYMYSRDNNNRLLNYIHAENGFIDMADKNKRLIPFNWKYVTTNKINTKYLNSSKISKIASMKIKDCLTKNELKQGFGKYKWLANMTVADFIKTFFNELANGDHDIKIQLWQVLLDAIEGNKSRRKAVILLGSGSNGKSMYADLIRAIIGTNNVASLTLGQIGADNSSRQNFYLSQLVNKTVDIADDAGDGLVMKDDGAFKTIVSGGDLTIAVKNKDNFSTHINMLIIQPCNKMPNVKKISQAVFDRLLIIPFKHKFNMDGSRKIPADLLEDILNNNAVDEYVLYHAVHQANFNNYHQSKESKEALIKYENNTDKTRAFARHFLKWDIDRIPVQTTYQLYRQFTKDNGSVPERASSFNDEFRQLIKSRFCHKSARYNEDQINKIINLDVKLPSYDADRYYPDMGATLKSYVRLPF